MLVEKSRDEALKAFLRGRKVLVLTEYDDGDMMAEDLARWLTEEKTRYLVSVPAVEKEEFATLGRTSKPAIPDPEADPVVDMDPAEEGASAADSKSNDQDPAGAVPEGPVDNKDRHLCKS